VPVLKISAILAFGRHCDIEIDSGHVRRNFGIHRDPALSPNNDFGIGIFRPSTAATETSDESRITFLGPGIFSTRNYLENRISPSSQRRNPQRYRDDSRKLARKKSANRRKNRIQARDRDDSRETWRISATVPLAYTRWPLIPVANVPPPSRFDRTREYVREYVFGLRNA